MLIIMSHITRQLPRLVTCLLFQLCILNCVVGVIIQYHNHEMTSTKVLQIQQETSQEIHKDDQPNTTCIGHCKCLLSPPNITINCQDQPPPNISQFNTFLSPFIKIQISRLEISQAGLPDVPEAVCNFTSLDRLNMSFNSIHKIDPECLSRMSHLTYLSMTHNYFTEFDRELIDGLHSIRSIDFSNNNIKSIANNTFNNLTMWPKLTNVHFDHNDLTSIGVWPLMRMLKSPGGTISLEYNNISKFTDFEGWHYTCNMPRPKGEIRLKGNQIHHISDIYHGWQYPNYLAIICMFLGESLKFSIVNNPYNCDCHEFKPMLYFTLWAPKSSIIPQLRCYTPPFPDLGTRPRMVSVPLNRLQCDIKDDCPENCHCIQRPNNRTFHIECQNSDVKFLPLVLPNRTSTYDEITYKYKLDFTSNSIRELEARNYLHASVIIDLSHNAINKISEQAFYLIQNASAIYLHNNQLSTLPHAVQEVKLVGNISLHDNAWLCDCTTLWMKRWMLSVEHKLYNPSGILCKSPTRVQGSNMLSLPDDEFICGEPYDTQLQNLILICVGSIVGTFMLFVVPMFVVYLQRVYIYTEFHWHPFDWDECDGEEMHYDVFISYADQDESWVMELLTWLEDEQRYRCCIHKRDFLPGAQITENIQEAISHSKRTLCVVSTHFLQSQFCLWELDMAIHEDIMKRTSRLIMVKAGDLPQISELPENFRRHISTFTYLDAENPKFYKKLKYVLPVRKLGPEQDYFHGNQDAAENSGPDTSETSPIIQQEHAH